MKEYEKLELEIFELRQRDVITESPTDPTAYDLEVWVD